MNTVHVYVSPRQPLTKYVDHNFPKPMKFRTNPRKKFSCDACGRRRWAKNLVIQVYYDMSRISCAEGHQQ